MQTRKKILSGAIVLALSQLIFNQASAIEITNNTFIDPLLSGLEVGGY